jgi:N-acetylglucosamine-6-phosphate deacetylase
VADLVLTGGAVLREGRWVPGDVVCRDGLEVAGRPAPGAEVRDVAGALVAPGLIDLQCNGALGIDVTRAPERLWELGAQLPRWGVTAWLPTVVTAPVGAVDAALAALDDVPAAGVVGAVPLGLHLEGPYLAPAARGAHPEALLRAASLEETAGWSRAAGVAVVTVAPERPGALALIRALAGRGVVVSLGHSAATVEEATAGIEAGATWVTHLFNGMPPFHHRSPGLPGVALTDERVRVGVIADGVHVAPAAVALAQRALGPRLVVVTDAVSPMGLPSEAPGAGVRLADGTLAGCDTPLDQAIRQLAAFAGCSTAAAVGAATAAPAAVLGDATRGHLEPGARADVVVLTEDLHLVATYVAGRLVHDARRPR